MTGTALLASRSGPVPEWFAETVGALGYDPTGTLTVTAPENGRYHLPPGLVARLEQRIAETDAAFVGVDGLVHPGQMLDLATALSSVTVRGRRGVVWQRLQTENAVAKHRLELRDTRVERRRVVRDERDSAASGPEDSGRVDELDRRCQRLQAGLETRRADARERVQAAYDGVDAHVTLVGPPTGETTDLWEGLTGQSASGGGAFSPARPVSAVTNAGPHELALTDTPGFVDGLPAWYTDTVPETQAALSRADVVVVAGETAVSTAELSRTVDERFDATVVPAPRSGSPGEAVLPAGDPVDGSSPEAVRTRLATVVPSERLALSLPYTDDAHALVSWLYDQGTVDALEYGERITVTVELSRSRTERLRQRLGRLDAETERLPD